MDFTTFANLLHTVIGMGSKTSTFTKTLFDTIITEEGKDTLDDYSESSFKSYFNGNQKITQLAQKISVYLDHEEFAYFINQTPDAVTDSLCDSFRSVLPHIDAFNVGEQLAGFFAAIIKEAASTKKKSTPKGAHDAETIAAEVVDDHEPSGAVDEDKKITVIQHQTNVVQNGENNFNLTNNGTMNFNL
ncbi:MAG: hypothetical protein RSD23_03650 [Ruthenibacterium sp.]